MSRLAPPPPPGFILEEPEAFVPPPPPGFVLENSEPVRTIVQDLEPMMGNRPAPPPPQPIEPMGPPVLEPLPSPMDVSYEEYQRQFMAKGYGEVAPMPPNPLPVQPLGPPSPVTSPADQLWQFTRRRAAAIDARGDQGRRPIPGPEVVKAQRWKGPATHEEYDLTLPGQQVDANEIENASAQQQLMAAEKHLADARALDEAWGKFESTRKLGPDMPKYNHPAAPRPTPEQLEKMEWAAERWREMIKPPALFGGDDTNLSGDTTGFLDPRTKARMKTWDADQGYRPASIEDLNRLSELQSNDKGIATLRRYGGVGGLWQAQLDFYADPKNQNADLPDELSVILRGGDGQWHIRNDAARAALKEVTGAPVKMRGVDRDRLQPMFTPIPRSMVGEGDEANYWKQRDSARTGIAAKEGAEVELSTPAGIGTATARGIIGLGAGATSLAGTLLASGGGHEADSQGNVVLPPMDDIQKAGLKMIDAGERMRSSAREWPKSDAAKEAWNPTSASWWIENTGESLPQYAAILTAAALGGPGAGAWVGAGMNLAGDGGEVAANVYRDLVNGGMDEREAAGKAALYGLSAGAASAALEKLNLDLILGGDSVKAAKAELAKRIFRHLAVSAGSEAGTEVLQGYSNAIHEYIATGKTIDWLQPLIEGALAAPLGALGGAAGQASQQRSKQNQAAADPTQSIEGVPTVPASARLPQQAPPTDISGLGNADPKALAEMQRTPPAQYDPAELAAAMRVVEQNRPSPAPVAPPPAGPPRAMPPMEELQKRIGLTEPREVPAPPMPEAETQPGEAAAELPASPEESPASEPERPTVPEKWTKGTPVTWTDAGGVRHEGISVGDDGVQKGVMVREGGKVIAVERGRLEVPIPRPEGQPFPAREKFSATDQLQPQGPVSQPSPVADARPTPARVQRKREYGPLVTFKTSSGRQVIGNVQSMSKDGKAGLVLANEPGKQPKVYEVWAGALQYAGQEEEFQGLGHPRQAEMIEPTKVESIEPPQVAEEIPAQNAGPATEAPAPGPDESAAVRREDLEFMVTRQAFAKLTKREQLIVRGMLRDSKGGTTSIPPASVGAFRRIEAKMENGGVLKGTAKPFHEMTFGAFVGMMGGAGRHSDLSLSDTHRGSVEKALREGRVVPPEVFADYPDLQPQKGAPDAQATEEAPAEVLSQGGKEVAQFSLGDTIPSVAEDEGAGRTTPPRKAPQRPGDNASIEASLKKRGVRGDALLNATDLANDLRKVGGIVHDDGTVTLYHRATTDEAKKIVQSQRMIAKEDGLFFGTHPIGDIEGYGDAAVKVRLPLEKIELNDVFGDREAHVRLPLGRQRSMPIAAELWNPDSFNQPVPAESGGTSPLLSAGDAAPSRGLPLRDAAIAVGRLRKEFSGINLRVIQSESELPADHREYIESRNATGRVKGMLDRKGQVWVIADNLEDTDDAVRAAWHEIVGHVGANKTILPGIQKRIVEFADRNAPELVREVKRSYGSADPAEIVARLSERYAGQEKPAWYRNILDAIRFHWRRLTGRRFSDNDIEFVFQKARKAAAQGAEGGEGSLSLAGEKSLVTGAKSDLLTSRENLAIAKKMDEAGKDNETIRLATGWLRGKYDKKWRYEIDDSAMKMKDPSDWGEIREAKGGPLTLADIIDHPKLFEAYPALREIRVVPTDNLGAQGSFNGNRIAIDTYAADYQRTLLHEIQHAIQNIEGFAKGSNSNIAKGHPDFDRLMAKVREGGGITDDPSNDERLVADAIYRRSAGEIEARDTAARADRTPEQRKATAPYSSENIPADQAIVRMDQAGPAESREEPKPLLDRLADAGDRAMKRIKSKIGTPLTGIPADQMADWVIVGAGALARLLKASGAKYHTFTTWAKEMARMGAEEAGATKDDLMKIWAKVRHVQKMSDEDREAWYLDKVTERESKEGAKARVDRLTGVRDTKAAREAMELLRSNMKRVLKANKAGSDAATAELQGIKKELARIIKETLPPELHGRFLGDVARIRTLGQMALAMQKGSRLLADHDLRAAVRDLENLVGPLKTVKVHAPSAAKGGKRAAGDVDPAKLRDIKLESLSLETREKIRPLMEKARLKRALMKTLQGATVDQKMRAVEEFRDIELEIRVLAANDLSAREIDIDGKRQTLAELMESVASTIGGTMETEATGEASGEKNWIKTAWRAHESIEPALQNLLGKDHAAVKMAIGHIRDGQRRVMEEEKSFRDGLDEKLEAAGIPSHSAAFDRWVSEREKIKLPSGTTVNITRGEILSLYGHLGDSQTGPDLEAGLSLTFKNKPHGMRVSGKDAKFLADMLKPEEKAIMDFFKKHVRDHLTEPAMAAKLFIDQYAPDPIPGYWPRKRNTEVGDPQPPQQNRIAKKFLESIPSMKERSGGNDPLQIIDALTVMEDWVHDAANLIHLAKPLHDVVSVMTHTKVKGAIERKYGPRLNKQVDQFIKDTAEATTKSPRTLPEKISRAMASKISQAWLTLNPKTMLRQAGPGFISLIPEFAQFDLLHGMNEVRKPGSYKRMIENSAVAANRYSKGLAGQYSPILEAHQIPEGRLGFWSAMRRAADMAVKMKPLKMVQKLDAAAKAIPLLQRADAIPISIAWYASESYVKRTHPDLDPNSKEFREARERKFQEAIYRTQNGNSSTEVSYIASRLRESSPVLALYIMFTSDSNKRLNQLARWSQMTWPQRARLMLAIPTSMAMSAAIGAGITWGTAALGRKIGGGDDDEEKKRKIEKEFWMRFGQEAAGISYAGDLAFDALSAIAYGINPEWENPVGGTITKTTKSTVSSTRAAYAWIKNRSSPKRSERKKAEEARLRMIKHLWRGSKDLRTIFGDPTVPITNMIEQAYDAGTHKTTKEDRKIRKEDGR